MNLYDTNVLSELRRPRPDPRVIAFVADHPLESAFASVITFAEIRFGIDRATDTQVKAELEMWLLMKIRPGFLGRTLEVTEDILVEWRNMMAAGRKVGRPYSEPDLLLAATARTHDLALITRNVRDFAGLDLKLINPWEYTGQA